MITFHIITLFPESFDSYLKASILSRATREGYVSFRFYNPRDFVVPRKKDKKMTYADRRVDDRPYGGGPGMVIEVLPVAKAVDKALKNCRDKKKTKIIFFTPAGKQFDNQISEKYKKYHDIILICGRYEGIDARIKKIFKVEEVSIGPYIITGGELPAMITIDSIARRIKGVLGDYTSIEESRVNSSDVYTRPEIVVYKNKKYRVPKILLSGHHKHMDEWKLKKRKLLK